MHSKEMQIAARKLRKTGQTHREIAKKLKIGIGSAHLWTKGLNLSKNQKSRAFKRAAARTFTSARRKQLSGWAKVALAKYREKHTKLSLIKKITDFYEKNGRIPLKREFNMHDQYLRHFKSWNDTIRIAGFDPNPILFSKKFIANDGHGCDSFTEKIIDDWFYKNNINHKRNYKYAETKMTADFFIEPNVIIEFFGLAGIQKNYDSIIKRKNNLAKKLNLKLIAIYPKHLFPLNQLKEVLSFLDKESSSEFTS